LAERKLEDCRMNTRDAQTILEKLKQLPPERLAEVEDFIDFLRARERRDAAFDAFLGVAERVQRAGIAPLSEAEIEAELDAARAERRARRGTG
jgi:hypothetical protein